MTLKNNRAPLLCCFQLCAWFHCQMWIPTGVRVRKPQIRVKIGQFLPCVALKFDRWPWKTIEHLFYADSSCVHDFIAICEFQLELRVRKRLSLVLTSVTLTVDLWPWPFAWTSLLSIVITPENFMMIRWWEHGEKGVTDGQMDVQTDGQTNGLNQSYCCFWSQLKKK